MTMEQYPRTRKLLVLEFAPVPDMPQYISVEVILDFDQFDDVVGIEVINLLLAAGPACLEAISKALPARHTDMRYSYDEESDCFYLKLRLERSRDQEAVEGRFALDQEGRIVAMHIELPRQPG